MFKFIHAADIHLDSPLRGLARYEGAPVERIRGATRQALERLVQTAIDEEVAFVMVAGDVFDGDWRDYNTGLYFAGQMSRLREQNIRVFLIAGNHDAGSTITRHLRMPENVHRFPTGRPGTVIMEEIRTAVHGRGFPRPDVTENIARDYPKARQGYYNIGILHTCCDGRVGHERYAPCKVGDLVLKNYDYWALGHVHTREILHESPWILFPGNIQGRHIRETGAKGCTIVQVGDNGSTSTEHKDLDVIRWTHLVIDATGTDTGEGVMRVVRAGLEAELDQIGRRMLAVRIDIIGSCPAHGDLTRHREKWINQIRADATDLSHGEIWVEKIGVRTSGPMEMERREAGDSPVGHLLRFLDKIESDPESLRGLTGELAALSEKLPAEFRYGDSAMDLEDPQWIEKIMPDIREMLVSRLMTIGNNR